MKKNEMERNKFENFVIIIINDEKTVNKKLRVVAEYAMGRQEALWKNISHGFFRRFFT